MQLAEALAALKEIEECANTKGLDSDLRMLWISQRAAEARAAACGNYEWANIYKIQCNAIAGLMRMHARAATVKPIVIGGEAEDADVENAIGKATWHRPPTGGQ